VAGFDFQLNPSGVADVGRRTLNGRQSSLLINPETGPTVRQRNVSQQILTGVRCVLQQLNRRVSPA
jgi:hypothetical protein